MAETSLIEPAAPSNAAANAPPVTPTAPKGSLDKIFAPTQFTATPLPMPPAEPATNLDDAQPGDIVTLTPEQQAEAEKSIGIINPIRDLTPDEMVQLKRSDPTFDFLGQAQSQPELMADPRVFQNVADAWGKYVDSTSWHDLPTPLDVGKNLASAAWGFLKRFGTGVGLSAKAAGESLATGENAPETIRGAGEQLAGTEAGIAGAITMLEHTAAGLARKTGFAKPLADRTPEQRAQFFANSLVEYRAQQKLLSGEGLSARTNQYLKEHGTPIRPDVVGEYAAGDPFSWEAMGKAFGLGAKAVKAPVGAALSKIEVPVGGRVVNAAQVAGATASAIGEKAESVAAATGGKLVSALAKGTEGAAKVVQKVAPAVGATAGAAIGATVGKEVFHGGGIVGGVAGFKEGLKIGKEAAEKAEGIGETAEKAGKLGPEISGEKPITSPYSQLAQDFFASIPKTAAAVGTGAALDLGMAAGAETPEESKSVGFGTGLGLLHGGFGAGKRILGGQLIGSRNFPIDPQKINDFLQQAAPGTKFIHDADPTMLKARLMAEGVAPETAELASQHNGISLSNVPVTDAQGKVTGTKRLIATTQLNSAPHELMHAIRNALPAEVNQAHFDKIKQAFSPEEWQGIGRSYAYDLDPAAMRAGADWREIILDKSNQGTEEAAKKVLADQLGRAPSPVEVLNFVRENPGLNWRDHLTQSEAGKAADNYMSREAEAEHFAADFAHSGTDIGGGKSVPERIAKMISPIVSAFGGEPLAGRVSPGQQMPLKSAVLSQTRKTVKPLIAPAGEEHPAEAAETIPSTPANEAQKAISVAAKASDKPVAGAKQSAREILGTIAQKISDGGAVLLSYLGAHGDAPENITSALPATVRSERRDAIEEGRNAPDTQRTPWDKFFFPQDVFTTKTGKNQVGGWSPAIFTANARRLAKTLSTNPELAKLSPFEIDPATGFFTPDAWTRLQQRLQTVIANHQAGRTGSGLPFNMPESMKGRGFFAPPMREAAGTVPQNEADFINHLLGFKLPDTAVLRGGRYPWNLMAQEASQATLPGRVTPLVTAKPGFGEVGLTEKNRAAQAAAAARLGIPPGSKIQEVNPFRASLENAAAGKTKLPDMLEAYQRLNLDRIAGAEHAAGVPSLRGNTVISAAGFSPKKPGEYSIRRLGDKTEISDLAGKKVGQAFTSNRGAGNYTLDAIDVDPEFQRQGYGEALLREVVSGLREQGAKMLKSSNEGSGTVQMLDRVFGRDNVQHFHGGVQIPFDEAVKIMDKDFGYTRSEASFAPQTGLQFDPSRDEFRKAARDRATEWRAKAEKLRPASEKATPDLIKGNLSAQHDVNRFNMADAEATWAEGIANNLDKAASAGPQSGTQFQPRKYEPDYTPGRLETPRDVHLVGPNGNRYPAQQFGAMDMRSLGRGVMPMYNLGSDVPNLSVKGSSMAHSTIEKAGYTIEHPAEAPDTAAQFNPHKATEKDFSDEYKRLYAFPGSAIEDAAAEAMQNDPDLAREVRDTFTDSQMETQGNGALATKYLRHFLHMDQKDPAVKALFEKHSEVMDLLNRQDKFMKDAVGGTHATEHEFAAEQIANLGLNPNQVLQDWPGFGRAEVAAQNPALANWIDKNAFPNFDTAQFAPSSDPRAVKMAAVRDDNGKLWVGVYHSVAEDAGLKAGATFKKSSDADQGFITNSGEYLNRDQAYERAKELKQVTTRYTRNFTRDALAPTEEGKPYLEAGLFEGDRQFQPSRKQIEDNERAFAAGKSSGRNIPAGWWLDPSGNLHAAPEDHEVTAQKILNAPGMTFGQSSEQLYHRGWLRAADVNGTMTLNGLDGRPTTVTSAQRAALENLGIQHDLPVKLSTLRMLPDRIAHDYTPIYEPPVTMQFQPGIVGSVEETGEGVTSKKVADLSTNGHGGESKSRAQGGNPWRYRPDLKRVYWWYHPNEAQKEGVESHLERKGFQVASHQFMGSVDNRGGIGEPAPGSEKAMVEAHGGDTSFAYSPKKADEPMFRGEPRKTLSPAEVASMTKAQTAAHFPESVIPKRKDDTIPYDTATAPLVAGLKTDDAEKLYGKKITAEAQKYEDHPSFQAGLGWYSRFVSRLNQVIGKKWSPKFAELLAATSPQNNPTINYNYALDALEGFKAGHYDAQIKKYVEGLKMVENGTWEKWLRDNNRAQDLKGGPTEASFLGEWILAHDLKPRKANGLLFGKGSTAVLNVLTDRWLENTEGPKTRNFVANLIGSGHDATIDVWAARLMRRLGYAGYQERWRILPKNERGVTDPDFFFSQRAFAHAAKELGVQPDALQGALWFAEKELWAHRGWSRLDLGDFIKEMDKTAALKKLFKQQRAESAAQPAPLVTARPTALP
jgi:GNAT superfamily N-acetyltransferase